MTDPTVTAEPTATAVSFVAPSGGAGAGAEAEGEAGTAMAEANAQKQEEARKRRDEETFNAREWASRAAAANDAKQAEQAEKIRGMVEDLPPAGPGMPEVDKVVIAATIDPNNEVLNPDMSRMGHRRNLPPGARVPAPVLPQDTVQTQFASKPATEEHARVGKEVAKGLDRYPPAGTQPTLELTPEEEEKFRSERGGRSGSLGSIEHATAQPEPYANPADPSVYRGSR